MDLEDLIYSAPKGVSNFLKRAKELGYNPIIADKYDQIRDAWTMVYGVEGKTFLAVYSVETGTRKHPTRNTVRKITNMHGRFDRKRLLEQGLANVASEMVGGEITPFLSESFDTKDLQIVIDRESLENSNLVRFPGGNDNYFAMPLKDVINVLTSVYGNDKIKVEFLF